ncbi:transcriptional regulator family: C2H2 zinc finger [Paecilomyces variotii]|nr:transcriptional regulator family: C2H2 zinc finger [Paecilomyces variotii]KAJ9329338.1 transcriptional regulator family: C2H2 zinc finger [Paecilomyces variotii]
METGVPLPYDLSAHNIGGLSSRRLMVSNMDHALPFYSSSPVTYASPCHSPYGYGHNILNTLPGHYQQLFGPRSQPPHPHSPPNIRHGRNILPGESRGSSFRPDQVSDLRLDTLAFGPTSNEGKQSKASEPAFSTEVDMLMKAIQSKSVPAGSHQPSHQLPSFQELSHAGNATYTPPYSNQQLGSPVTSKPTNQKSKRKYECTLPHCKKSFSQKTHLDIHMRAHTGDKPFVCKEPSCGQRFSQLGNLKTHERRHTGEKPYSCDICQKRFAQRGNVRAHKITHEQAKPFTCRLDDCGKQFTQLGNLKSHQNKFHAATIRNLTIKFSSMSEGDPMTPKDRELWEHFAELYKNSNKGIKGRGKDRRISSSSGTKSSSPVDGEHSVRRASISHDDSSIHHHRFELSSHEGFSSDDDVQIRSGMA